VPDAFHIETIPTIEQSWSPPVVVVRHEQEDSFGENPVTCEKASQREMQVTVTCDTYWTVRRRLHSGA
jgi:hypothetical protein